MKSKVVREQAKQAQLKSSTISTSLCGSNCACLISKFSLTWMKAEWWPGNKARLCSYDISSSPHEQKLVGNTAHAHHFSDKVSLVDATLNVQQCVLPGHRVSKVVDLGRETLQVWQGVPLQPVHHKLKGKHKHRSTQSHTQTPLEYGYETDIQCTCSYYWLSYLSLPNTAIFDEVLIHNLLVTLASRLVGSTHNNII